MLGIWKDTETPNHLCLTSLFSSKLILGSQDVLQPTSPYKTNSSGNKGLPSSIGIVCSFSADRGSQIPPWQNQVQHHQLPSGIGISLFWSDLPNCHGCSSEWFPGNHREFRGRKQRPGHTSQKQSISQFISSQWEPVQTAVRFRSWQILCNHYLSTKRMIKSSLSPYCFRADFSRRTFCPPPAGCWSSPPCHSSSSPSTYTATGTGSPQQGTFPAKLTGKDQNPQTHWSW